MTLHWIKVICLTGLIVTFGSSCKDKHPGKKEKYHFYEEDFKERQDLNGKSFKLTNIHLAAEICVVPEKNLLLLIDIKDRYLIKAYELNSMKYLRAFAEKGGGSGQLLMSISLQYDKANNLIYTFDPYNKRIFSYSVDDILSESSTVMPVSIREISTSALLSAFVFSNHDVVSFNDNFVNKQKGVLNIYDENGHSKFVTGSYPSIKRHYKPIELSSAFGACLDVSQDQNNIIVSYIYTDYLDLYNREGKLINRVQGPDIFEPEMISRQVSGGTMTHPTKDAHMGYNAKPRMKGNDLYVLYSGKSAADKSYEVNKLFNFNMELKPQKLISLDKSIFAFDIDWNANAIYGISHVGGMNIIKYNL